MDSDRIEEILNKGFPAEEPEGMRDRILSKSSRELRPSRANWWPKAKLAFAGAVLLLLISANISDRARESKIAGFPATQHPMTTEPISRVMADSQALTREMIARMGSSVESSKMREQL
jgi:hypothetical protein